MNHYPFHRVIGDFLQDKLFPGYKILKSPACGGAEPLPLYPSIQIPRPAEYCNVDILFLHNHKIRVIIEIDETYIEPFLVCGKFLTSALSSCYIDCKFENNTAAFENSVLFLHIMDTSFLEDKTLIKGQFSKLEESINSVLPIKFSHITKYRLIWGSLTNLADLEATLFNALYDFLRQ